MQNKIGIISQARMGSSRLPGKVMLKILNRTLLDFHLKGLMRSPFDVMVATTHLPHDQKIVDECKKHGVPSFCGEENDVLSRFYFAAKSLGLQHIVRVTSDCPLLDGTIIQAGVNEYLSYKKNNIYLSNTQVRTFPRGMDFEIFSFDMLEQAHKEAKLEHEREHVTPYFYMNSSNYFERVHYTHQTNMSDWRLTVDTQDDFALISKLIIEHRADEMNYDELCKLLLRYPEYRLQNQHVEQKKVVSKIHFILADESHSKMLFDWRNDPETIAQSLNSKKISWDEHQNWFSKTLKNKNPIIYMATIDSQVIGWVRTQIKDSNCELSWLISPEFRGKRLGSLMLSNFVKEFSGEYYAQVKENNLSSLKTAEKAGFTKEAKVDQVYTLKVKTSNTF